MSARLYLIAVEHDGPPMTPTFHEVPHTGLNAAFKVMDLRQALSLRSDQLRAVMDELAGVLARSSPGEAVFEPRPASAPDLPFDDSDPDAWRGTVA